MAEEVRVLLATDRAGVEAWFERVAAQYSSGIQITRLDPLMGPLDPRAATPAVAVIDVAIESTSARRLAQRLHEALPSLPMVALVCCTDAANPERLGGLARAGVDGLIDMHASPSEILAALRGAAKGDIVVRLRLNESYKRLWRGLMRGESPGIGPALLSEADLELLDLVTTGLGDREMGARMNLSPHTVKHRIEHLRHKLGLPNRIALAAWAGKHVKAPRAGKPEPEFDVVR